MITEEWGRAHSSLFMYLTVRKEISYMSNSGGSTVLKVSKLAESIAKDLGLIIWDVEFVKEGKEHFLRIYIDKENGNVDINDCEQMSKALDEPLDKLDPISCSYCLEVSSPGIERKLTKAEHFLKLIGEEVKIKLIRPNENGEREFIAKLLDYDKNTINIELNNKSKQITLKDTVYVKLNAFK